LPDQILCQECLDSAALEMADTGVLAKAISKAMPAMTDTQTLEGAKALLLETVRLIPTTGWEYQTALAKKIDAFLRLPSAAPAPSSALREAVDQFIEANTGIGGSCDICFSVKNFPHSDWCHVGKFRAALAAEEAQ